MKPFGAVKTIWGEAHKNVEFGYLLTKNRFFFPHKIEIFVGVSDNFNKALDEMQTTPKELKIYIWLNNTLNQNSYFIRIKTVKIGKTWGNRVTLRFKRLDDAIQYKLIWN